MGNLVLNKSHIKELLWLSTGQIFSMALGFISISLMTSVGASEYGIYVLATSIMGILTLTFFGPLEQAYVRQYFNYSDDPKSKNIYLKSLIKILKLCGVVLIVLTILVTIFANKLYNVKPIFVLTASLMISFGAVVTPLNGMINAFRLRKYVAIFQILERLLVILVLILLLNYFQKNATALFLSVAISYVILLALKCKVYKNEYRFVEVCASEENVDSKIEREVFKRIINYGFPFILWGGISWMQLNGERWVINYLLNTSEVGRYGLTATLLNSTGVVASTIIAQFFSPIIYKHFSSSDSLRLEKAKSLINVQCLATIIIFVSLALVLLFFGDYIIILMSSESFIIDNFVLFIFAIGYGLFYTTQALTSIGLSFEKPQVYLLPKIISAGFSIIAYYIGCKLYGINGVAVAILISSIIYLMLVLITNRQFRT